MAAEMGIFETMYNCRAMRRLKPDPVPEPVLQKLIDAANRAPTGSNLQGVRWIIVRDAEQKKKLAALNKAAVTRYAAADSGRSSELPHQNRDKRRRMLDAVLWQADHLQDVPALIIACHLFDGPVQGAATAGAGGSVWPAVQNLLLAARALELGAAPTTLGLSNAQAVKEILELPDNVAAYCLIPVGYPTGKFGPVTRLPVEETLRWDRWS